MKPPSTFVDPRGTWLRRLRECRGDRIASAPRPFRCGGILVALAVLCASQALPAYSADYYFSDCAAGGSGTITNPWCLDPGGNGGRESLMYLFDGTGPEAVAGDRIFLCAGTCDGIGSATFRVNCTGTYTDDTVRTYWFRADNGGSVSSPIVIQPYTDTITGNRENVVISGDSNGDGVYQAPAGSCSTSVDVDALITNQGMPNVSAIQWKNLTLEKSGYRMVVLDDPGNGTSGGPDNWVFDGMTFRYVGSPMWNGVTSGAYPNFYDANDPGHAGHCWRGSQYYAMKVRAVTGPFTVKNSIFHSICGFPHRNTNNDGGGGAFLFDNNEYYNCSDINNDFLNLNADGSRWATFIWRNNFIHDAAGGFSVEDRNRGVIIEDNLLACLGQYKLHDTGRCDMAIQVSDGSGVAGATSNVTIRRNRIYANVTNPSWSSVSCPSSSCGWFLAGIIWQATCNPALGNGCTNSGGLIENNFIWNRYTPTLADCEKGAICVQTNNDDVVVRNNTIYQGTRGITLLGTGRNYTVVNNLISNLSDAAIWSALGTLTSKINYNNAYSPSGTIMNLGGTAYICSALSGFGIGNKCAATSFMNVSGSKDLWNLHLASSDTANPNVGTAGPADDIDKQIRTGAVDIGADELGGSDTVPPGTPTNLRFVW